MGGGVIIFYHHTHSEIIMEIVLIMTKSYNLSILVD